MIPQALGSHCSAGALWELTVVEECQLCLSVCLLDILFLLGSLIFSPFCDFTFSFECAFLLHLTGFLWALSLRDPLFIHFSLIMFVFPIELQCTVNRCYTTLHKVRARLENASGMLWAFVGLSLCKINFLLSFFPSGHSVLGSLEPFTSCSNYFSLQVRIIWACEMFSEEEKDEHSARVL